jgi:hypothetical protein
MPIIPEFRRQSEAVQSHPGLHSKKNKEKRKCGVLVVAMVVVVVGR